MAHLLIVDDEESICWGLSQLSGRLGHTATIAASAEDAFIKAEQHQPDAIILDIRLPGMDGLQAMAEFHSRLGAVPIVVITAHGNLDTAVTAVRNNAFDYLPKPFDLDQAAEVIRRAVSASSGEINSAVAAQGDDFVDELLGRCPPMQHVFKQIALVAPTDISVLLTGESGTGKELVARAVHRHSLRASNALISVNLAALSPTLIESELFGHVRGAFTGAENSRRGLLEMADGATVFFDEVGDIPLNVQVKLLRVLEQHEVTPVGDTRPRKTFFRVIAATNRDLNEAMQQGTFREDLFFRLAGMEIKLPAIRERKEDISLLAEHFLSLVRATETPCRGFSREAIESMQNRTWPGNVRELRHAVEHAAMLARGGFIEPNHLPPPRQHAQAALSPCDSLQQAVKEWASLHLNEKEASGVLYERFLAEAEPPLFDAVLEKTDRNRSAAADLLGIHRATLRKRLDGEK